MEEACQQACGVHAYTLDCIRYVLELASRAVLCPVKNNKRPCTRTKAEVTYALYDLQY